MRNIENKKRLNREWYFRKKNDPVFLEQKKDWYLKNRERILREKREKNALKPRRILKTEEEKRLKRDVWRQQNKEKINKYALTRRKENLQQYKQYAKEYYESRLSYKVRYNRLLKDARHRHYEVALTLDEFTKLSIQKCIYCGESEKRIGIDRVDNTVGYTKDNCAPCCKVCNYMKKTLSVQDFISHITKIYIHATK